MVRDSVAGVFLRGYFRGGDFANICVCQAMAPGRGLKIYHLNT